MASRQSKLNINVSALDDTEVRVKEKEMKDAATSPTRYDPNDFTFSGKEVTFSELVVLEKSSKKD